MTVPDLITLVLGAIRNQFYADRVREFKRDERALLKAVASYGYECQQRGWHFDAPAILRDLMSLLNELKLNSEAIGYLPVYLHGAVRRHIGQRAEELQSQARTIRPKVTRVVSGVSSVQAVIEPSSTEILSTLYRDLSARRPPRRKPAKQAELF